MAKTTIAWLRNDLRMADNPALSAAGKEGDTVVALYIHETDVGIRPPAYETFPLTVSLANRRQIETSVEAVKIMRPMQPGDVTATYADVSKLNALTGYSPQVTLAQGLSRFARWWRDSGLA